MPENYYITDLDLMIRGWGFPAEPCDPGDPEVVCATGDGTWLKPVDVERFNAWIKAGKPRDDESLRSYGFTHGKNG